MNMPTYLEYRIIATDGENQYQIYSIKKHKDGDLYLGNGGDKPTRISVHQSGVVNTHFEFNDGRTHTDRKNLGSKIDEIKGLVQICFMSIGRDVVKNPLFSTVPKKKKREGFVYFDLRNFQGAVNISIHILENGNYAALSGLHKIFPNVQLQIFTEMTPWFVVALSDSSKEN